MAKSSESIKELLRQRAEVERELQQKLAELYECQERISFITEEIFQLDSRNA